MNLVAERNGASTLNRLAHLWPLLWIIFLPNLADPLTALFHAHPSPWRLSAVLAAVTLFLAFYLWAAWQNRTAYPAPAPRGSGRRHWVPVAVLVGVSVALILGDGARWLSLLIFTSAAAGGRFSLGRAICVVAALALLTAILGRLTHDTVSDYASGAFWTGIAGILTIIVNHFRRTNHALRVAREEIARLAVEAERLRFARDLHDLLGHDLARIALQSEVAEALAPQAPDQAIAVMHDIGNVARKALQEVRATVAGYRRPTLLAESRAAGEILAAAGIAYRYEGERIELASEVEAVPAWAVREGVTNVIKHSRARHCTVRLTRTLGDLCVEVIDDGPLSTDAPRPGIGGSGLAGLAERAAALGGHCEAGPCPGGGFHLRVTIPVEPGAAGAVTDRTTAPIAVGTPGLP